LRKKAFLFFKEGSRERRPRQEVFRFFHLSHAQDENVSLRDDSTEKKINKRKRRDDDVTTRERTGEKEKRDQTLFFLFLFFSFFPRSFKKKTRSLLCSLFFSFSPSLSLHRQLVFSLFGLRSFSRCFHVLLQCIRRAVETHKKGGQKSSVSSFFRPHLASGFAWMVTPSTLISSTGLSFSATLARSILSSVSNPPMTFPKTVCRPSRCGHAL